MIFEDSCMESLARPNNASEAIFSVLRYGQKENNTKTKRRGKIIMLKKFKRKGDVGQ